MNGLIQSDRTSKAWSPTGIVVLGLGYELALGALDYSTPPGMSFTFFYLLGIGFVGWGAGVRASILISALAAGIMTALGEQSYAARPLGWALWLWNTSTRFLLFCACGWLTAEITRLNRHLQGLVIARTTQLQKEIEEHKSTLAQLGEALARLRTIIAKVPIIIFAVDRQGIITFEDGQALAALGVGAGAHVGQTVAQAYGRAKQSREVMEHMRRALAGEEFNAPVQLAGIALETWYSPTRESDGTVNGYTGIAVNVTEQRRLERQILEISDREQARLGQEIHDGLCQQLVSLAFDANTLSVDLLTKDLPEARMAKRIADYLDQAITESRQLSRGLFPIRLDAQGLPSALEELARATRERFGVECRLMAGNASPVKSRTIATHLYRIAQEAINNAIKHGHAKSIALSLQTTDSGLELGVRDNGVGISLGSLKDSRGMGLHIMDYRARSVGGSFSFSRAPDGGTLISCCVPGQSD